MRNLFLSESRKNKKHNLPRVKFAVGQRVRITGRDGFGKVLPITSIDLYEDHPVYEVGTMQDTGGAFGYLCCSCDIEAV